MSDYDNQGGMAGHFGYGLGETKPMARTAACGTLCTPGRHQGGCYHMCGERLDCGGDCCLDRDHHHEHECIGDEPGNPGSCPA